LLLSFTLEGVEGLAPREEPQLVRSSDDETASVWSSHAGITDAFIVLSDVPAPPHMSPEGDVSAVSMEVPNGTAFVVNIELAETTGGLAQQLDVPTVAVAERTIAGAAGYELALPNGQLNIIWPTDNPDRWGSLIISSPLAARVDEIVSAVVAG
jgi:hypothetical protein